MLFRSVKTTLHNIHGNDIENIIRPDDGRVAIAKSTIKGRAATSEGELDTAKSETWKKLGSMVTRTTDLLKAVETSFIGSDDVGASVKGQIHSVKTGLRADAATIKKAADANQAAAAKAAEAAASRAKNDAADEEMHKNEARAAAMEAEDMAQAA